jgi:xanthine dehydrogenase YagT iron-sulfur-binding subunit
MANDETTSSPLDSGGGDLDEILIFGNAETRRQFIKQVAGTSAAIAVGASFLNQPAFANQPTPSASPKPAGGDSVKMTLRVNGKDFVLEVDSRTTLLDALRERLHLTGSKMGCDHGQCGACTVLVNGRRINSCLSLALMHEGDEITTIEGLANGDELHPMQTAFIEQDGLQCGYCTPGQICSAVALLKENHANSDDEIREFMSGNICRCGAYPNILAAIKDAKSKSNA